MVPTMTVRSDGGAMRTVFDIRDTGGILVAQHVRLDRPDGTKTAWWVRPGCDSGLGGLGTPALPLFGAEYLRLIPVGATVIISEGEKATAALRTLHPWCLGTVTGASSCPGEDALAPLLPFDVVLWPDHDLPGEEHMARVAAGIMRLGGRARRLGWGAAHGDDAADFVAAGGTRVTLYRLIRAASPWVVLPTRAPSRARPMYDDGSIGLAGDALRREAARRQLVEVVIAGAGQPAHDDRGGLWWCCPFHDEQTPSFKVAKNEPYYRCFGCGARGDVFTFMRQHANRGYRDTLAMLSPGLGAIPRLGMAG